MVFVQTQRVNATTVRFSSGVLTGNEADTEQRLQVGLDQRLQGPFQVRRVALQFGGGATRQAEEFDVAHGLVSRRGGRSSFFAGARFLLVVTRAHQIPSKQIQTCKLLIYMDFSRFGGGIAGIHQTPSKQIQAQWGR